MAPVLKLHKFLRIIRIARDYIKRFPARGASILAFFGRKLNRWCRFWLGIFGHPTPKPAERQFGGPKASSSSVPGGFAAAGECVVAASYVPASASHPNLHEHDHTESQRCQPAQTADVYPPVLASNAVDHSPTLKLKSLNLPDPLGGGSFVNRSSDNLSVVSIHSRASDRHSIITNSRESIRATLGQPSRLSRETHRLDQLRSRERALERALLSPSPTTRLSTHHPPHLEIITALPSHGGGKVGPVVEPLASSSYTHEPPSPPPMNEIRRRRSSTSIVLNVQYPSTESFPISSSTSPPKITDELFAVDYFAGRSSPDSPAVDLYEEPTSSPTSSDHPTLDLDLPEGRFLQLINSDQIPRYTKDATMQVGYTILSLHPYISLQTPHGDSL